MRCFGHRGAKGYEIENTCEGIEKAISLSVYGVEFDVHAVHGQLVVHHDAQIRIPHQGLRTLESFTLDELSRIDLGAGRKIPRFEDIVATVQQRVVMNIELKGSGGAPILAQKLDVLCQQGYKPGLLLVSSFHHRELENFHRLLPSIPTGLLLYGVPRDIISEARACGCTSVHMHLESVDSSIVAEIHSAGLLLYVYTVNEKVDIERMRALGVDGVFSDFPDRV